MSETVPRILIVDDSPSVVENLRSLLAAQGFPADGAYSANDALHMHRRDPYSIVICDIEMPGKSGFELLEELRQEEQPLDFVFMTAYLEPEYFQRAIRLGASDFIQKPVDSRHLLSTVKASLQKAQASARNDNFMQHLEVAQFSCVLNPASYLQHNEPRRLGSFLQRNLPLPPETRNAVIACLDEMLANALVHGTLGLSPQQRGCSHSELQTLIAALLQQPHIANRRIRLEVTVDRARDLVSIGVEDDGDGFDHADWQRRLEQQPGLNTESHGRGLFMLYHLCDRLEFLNGGRKVRITRKITPNSTSEA